MDKATADFQKISSVDVFVALDVVGNSSVGTTELVVIHIEQLSLQRPFHINTSVSTAYSELISTLITNDLIPSLNFENDD